MAKTRMLKHDLRKSVKVASWPIEVRYFWALLWGYVDDHGKAVDNSLLVKADCFPLDPDITGEVVDGWLWKLAAEGVIVRYTFDGIDYLQVKNWREHQKPPHPTDDILPAWDSSGASLRTMHEGFMHDAGMVHEPLTPVLGLGLVKSGSEIGIESSPAVTEPVSPLVGYFDKAWQFWPKKVERKQAFEKYKIAVRKVGAPQLHAIIERFGNAYAETTEKQFVPALGVWLSHERWTDELPSRRAPQTRTEENLGIVAHYAQAERTGLQA